MRWIVLAKLPLEHLNSDLKWALDPTFYRIEDEDGFQFVEDDKEKWSIGVMHAHWNNPLNPGNSPPDMFPCGIINRDGVLNNKPQAFPEYQCNKCGKEVPKKVVEKKIEHQSALRGIDPRNDRRGAVLATRKANPQKES